MWRRLIVAAVIVLGQCISAPIPSVSAAACDANTGQGSFQLLPTWYKYLETVTVDNSCQIEKFDVPDDLWKVGLAMVEILLRIAGWVATGYVIVGGFKYVLSKGNPQDAAKARQTIIDAAIGIAIASLATVLVGFIGRTLTR
jgi:hypothetical protein